MRVLITGASGFAGRHLIDLLRRDTDWQLIGLRSRPGADLHAHETLTCDLRDANAARALIRDCSPGIIFHLAARSSVPESFLDPAETLRANVFGQLNLFEAVRSAGASPVIVIASSSEIYGAVEPDELPIKERQQLRPASPYAVSKATQDLLAGQYHLSHRMRIIRARPFNHIGPGQSDRFVVSSFARQIAGAEAGMREPIIEVGNLDAERDFLDVRDVVRAYRLLAAPDFSGEVFNVSSGTPRKISEVLERLLAESRVRMTVRLDPERQRPSDTPVIYGDSSRLRERTGWEPLVPFEQSLRDILDFWREDIQGKR